MLGTEKTSDKDTDFNALVTKIKAHEPRHHLLRRHLQRRRAAVQAVQGSRHEGSADGRRRSLRRRVHQPRRCRAAEGDFATSVGLPIDKLPKGQEFTAAYKAMFPNDEIAAYDAYAYDATNVIIKADPRGRQGDRAPTRSRPPRVATRSSLLSQPPRPRASRATSPSTPTATPRTRPSASTSCRGWRVDHQGRRWRSGCPVAAETPTAVLAL